jgi:hypothetical protein
VWPARPRMSAVVSPIPLLVPVTSTVAMMCFPLLVVDGRLEFTTWGDGRGKRFGRDLYCPDNPLRDL